MSKVLFVVFEIKTTLAATVKGNFVKEVLFLFLTHF